MMAAATLLAASCADFDDYNEAYTQGGPESTKTLWENISSRENLSDFARLLVKGGYDKELGNTRFYTVWAPENGTFDAAACETMDSTTLVERFIKSHVADYNFPLAASVNERVHSLNKKSFLLKNDNAGYTYGGNVIESLNNPSVNGVLHIINGAVRYLPNIYEYIFDQADTDTSMAKYFKHYETEYLDVANSVPGPIDSLGRQTYSDSVIVKDNTLLRNSLRAFITNEDSLYTFLLPTDEAYGKAYDKIKTYFKYNTEMKYYPITADGVETALSKTEANGDYDGAYLSDSIVRINIAKNLTLSHGNKYNYWLEEVDGPQPVLLDTICSTTRGKLSHAREIISHTIGEPVRMSNGYTRRLDSLMLAPWEVWCPEINVSVLGNKMRPLVKEASANIVSVTKNDFDGSIGGYVPSYLDLVPSNDGARPEAYFYLSGIRSTKYNVYVVMMPANVWKGSAETEKIVQFDISLNYMTSKGVGTASSPTTSFKKVLTDSVNLGKIDTLLVGEVEFPYAYAAISDDCMPYLSIKINRNKYNSKEKNYDNRLRIGGIILRPVEYDEYLKKMNDYEYSYI